MTEIEAFDQVLFALAFDDTSRSAGDTRTIAPCLDDKRQQRLPADVSGRRSARTRVRGTDTLGSVQNISHFWFGLSGARHWLKR